MRARSRTTVGAVFTDLDGFKSVNDTLGHQAGDELLRVVARRLTGATRDSDTVARVGGDEFVIVLPDVAGEPGLGTMTARLSEAVERPVRLAAGEVTPRLSIGTVLAEDGEDPESLLRRADELMYEAKRARPGR